MRNRQGGYVFLLVLVLLALASMLITPSLQLAYTILKSKRIHTSLLLDQYARDAGGEYAVWQVLYGTAVSQLTQPGDQIDYSITLNGQQVTVAIRMQSTLEESAVPGAENNRIRPTKTVVCDQDGDDYDDNCLALPLGSGMRAQYTVSLKQVSPDTSVGLEAIYDELPKGFTMVPGSVTTPDGSFPEIVGLPVINNCPTPGTACDIQPGGDEIWKWRLASPVYFNWGQVKKFTFTANFDASQQDRHCNKVLLKMQQPPHEQSDKTAIILVGASPPEGCDGGGTKVVKYVDKSVAPAGQTTIFTYIVNVQNVDKNTLHIASIKDVLPQGGFTYCNLSSTPPCDPPKYKISNDPFDSSAPGAFTDLTGYTDLADPVQTYLPAYGRWQLFWDGPGGAGWNINAAGSSGDNMLLRLQAQITPVASGSYYNEVFIDISTGCTAPVVLRNEGITTNADYCASYSWPTGGVIVPTYDIRSLTQSTRGQGNLNVDWVAGSLEGELQSWDVK